MVQRGTCFVGFPMAVAPPPTALRMIIFIGVAVQSLSRVRLCEHVDCSTPGFPVLHHLLEVAQIHVH